MGARQTLIHSVGESMYHIYYPVAKQVLQHVLEKVGVLDFFRKNGTIDIVTDFSSTSKAVDRNGNPDLHPDRCRARLNMNVNPSSLKWQGNGTSVDLGNGNFLVTQHNGAANPRNPVELGKFAEYYTSVFSDPETFTDLKEYIVGSTLSLEVQCDFKDESAAVETLQRLYSVFTNGEMIQYVDIQYDYPIPAAIQMIMSYVNSLRKTNEPWTQWARRNSGGAISIVQHRDDPSKRELVANKNQFEALFHIDCSQEFPESIQPDGGRISFTITLQFARVNRLMLKYPIIVNNQFVDFNYLVIDPQMVKMPGVESPIVWDSRAAMQFWMNNNSHKQLNPLHYPWWDNWDVPSDSAIAQAGFYPLAIVAFTLDDEENDNGVTIIDLLKGLPGFTLNAELLREIQLYKNVVLSTTRYLNISVFAEDMQVGTYYQIEDNIPPVLDLSDGRHLIVRARRKHVIYRLVISINPTPVNLTMKPLSAELYPSRFVDLLADYFTASHDKIVNDGKEYYLYDKTSETFKKIEGVEPGTAMAEVVRAADDSVVYERHATSYGAAVINAFDTVVGYTATSDKIADGKTTYYIFDTETSTIKEITLEEGTAIPDDGSILIKRDTLPKYYVLKQKALSGDIEGTTTKVVEDVYAEVEVNEGETIEDVKERLGVDELYEDNPNKAPDEPTTSATANNQNYIDSYNGRRVANVELVTIHVSKKKDPGV